MRKNVITITLGDLALEFLEDKQKNDKYFRKSAFIERLILNNMKYTIEKERASKTKFGWFKGNNYKEEEPVYIMESPILNELKERWGKKK